jgi:hypothetical protein
MAMEAQWNPLWKEPRSQVEIASAIDHLTILISNSKTNPPVSKGLSEQLAALKAKLGH